MRFEFSQFSTLFFTAAPWGAHDTPHFLVTLVSFICLTKCDPPPLPLKNLSYVLAFLPHVVYSCPCKGSEKGPAQVKESFRQFSCLFIKVSYFVPTSDRHGIMATQDKHQPRMESES